MIEPSKHVEYKGRKIPHYYGDVVRILFLIAGVIILLSLPFYNGLIPINTSVSTVCVILLAFGAAIVNPQHMWIVLVNTVIAAVALAIFEYYAVVGYGVEETILVIVRQLLAVLFLFALYYSGKTLRAMLMRPSF